MSRPNRHIDQKLIKVGVKILEQKGLKGISVREICNRANVNLGMFSYLFQNKDNYLKILFETVRLNLICFLNLESVKDFNSFEKMKYVYQKMIDYTFLNKNLMRSMIVDAALDKQLYETYLKKRILQPFDLPFELIEQAQNDGYIRKDVSKYKIHYGIVHNVFVPILLSDCKIFMFNREDVDLDIKKEEYLSWFEKILNDLRN